MRSFKKDKCLGPDGWTIDIFIHFFDIMKKDMLGMVEETRMQGRIDPHISSTYIALIPKKIESSSFADYRPISLCNSIYKIISKLIAEGIRGNLSAHISKEQHGFLNGRNILDAVAITQEALQSMHTRNIEAAILKIDLKKAFDCLDWSFLRCLLIKIGLNGLCTNWVMACVQDINFSILINGYLTIFFRAEKGLRQGCSLSPILFILAMDSLSLHIKRAVVAGKVGPLAISRGNLHTHNLFVDDVLLFARLCRKTWQYLHVIFLSFQKATSLSINEGKSSFYFGKVIEAEMEYISRLYNIQAFSIQEGLKYLGFHLKPTGYYISDWSWLTHRFYKRISGWEFKCLLLAGRMILAQSVLGQICVYWAQLFFIPSAIVNKLNRLMATYIWGGNKDKTKFHLTKLENITLPKKIGRSGIMNLRLFGMALLCKSLWRVLFGNSLWSQAIKMKYLGNYEIFYWQRNNFKWPSQGSSIWRSFQRILPFFCRNFIWAFHSGCNILIGVDSIKGIDSVSISPQLLSILHSKGIFFWAQVIEGWKSVVPQWKTCKNLGLDGAMASQWKSVIYHMRSAGFHRSEDRDQIEWQTKKGNPLVLVRDIYLSLIELHKGTPLNIFPPSLWKTNCPLKVILFSWLVFHNKNLTWTNLQKRGW